MAQPEPRKEWNYAPELPIGNNPLFDWPLNIRAIFIYYRDSWLTLSEVSLFAILAIGGWWAHQAGLGGVGGLGGVDGRGGVAGLEWGWAIQVWLRNLFLLVLFAGGFHWLLHHRQIQGTERKYVSRFGHRGGARFSFGSQLYDNMFWSLASGLSFWTAYEVGLFWAQARGFAPVISFAENPVWFIALFGLTGFWVAFHFYWGHRLLHVGPLYRYVHALHHRNVNVGPWSGISMHPVEHAIYFSSMLIHLVVPTHPMHVMFHGYMLALSAVFGHTGFHALLIRNRERLMLGHFHHQLHHRYFECNYGSVDFPLDKVFGTFHDGSEAARKQLRSRVDTRIDE